MKKSVKILAIESSCDETAAAVVENGTTVLSNIISTQIDLHKKYGGVVPEIAARAHIENIIPVIASALNIANCDWNNIGAIAVTQGPGLLGSLLIGVNTARTLAYLKKKPLIVVNHLEGHIYANFVRVIKNQSLDFARDKKSNIKDSDEPRTTNHELPKFPILALTVSGGHTNIIYMKEHLHYKILGQTIDDAAGEAFDKVAKLLDLGYPGGPIISKLAEKGNPTAYDFPRTDLTSPPKRDSRGYLVKPKPNLNFSFAGLKTAVLTEIKKCQQSAVRGRHTKNINPASCELPTADLSASFQQAVIDILIRNTANAIKMYKPKSVLLSGGVAANKQLRKQLSERLAAGGWRLDFFVPPKILCTDNATMIGAAAYQKYLRKNFTDWRKLSPDPNLKLK